MAVSWFEILLIGVPLAFLAGFIDAIAGGGGTITLPAMLLLGFSPVQAVATNKAVAIWGSIAGVIQYAVKGQIKPRLALAFAPVALAGSWLGAFEISKIANKDSFEKWASVLIIGVGVIVLLRKKFGLEDKFHPSLKSFAAILVGCFVIGAYDGFFGPGTGTFLIFMFSLAGMGFVSAAAHGRVVNMYTNLAAFIFFLFGGKIIWLAAVPMGIANALGSALGARTAVKGGSAWVRPMYLVVIVLIVLRLILI